MKKKLFSTLLLSAVATMATAEGYDYLTIKQQDGTITRLPATGVTITFDGENLTATAAGSYKEQFNNYLSQKFLGR